MSTLEGIHDNLLQGVSQQVPRSRLSGQLTMQENMLSDPVTGLRRRSGLKLEQVITGRTNSAFTLGQTKAWRTDIGGVSCEIYIDTALGDIHITDNENIVRITHPYLRASDERLIRHASVGDSLYIANLSKVPTSVIDNTTKDRGKAGYGYIRAAALSKTYSVSVKYSRGTNTYTRTGVYTTPDGTDPTHIEQSTPEYIAQKLKESLDNISGSSLLVERDGVYLYFHHPDSAVGDMTVTTSAGSSYIGVSGAALLTDEGDLPPRLPDEADGLVIAVGRVPNLTYYHYEASRNAWVEGAAPKSVKSIINMPVEIYWNADTNQWALDASHWEGRTAGDDHSNPDPDFIDWGITGLGAYQGRLVILSGSWVWLSATNKPRQFYRSTVNDLLDSDPIGLGSSSATSAAFQYAVPFNKDLLLFSNEFQALIPSGNAALTPANANVVVTSNYSMDNTPSPIALGRSVVYSAPRSSAFYGIMEMLPSPYTDSQYVSADITEHIPEYLEGRCRFITASSVSGIVVTASTKNVRELYIHEYVWDGDEKVLRAWHKWSFDFDILYGYFSGDRIRLLTSHNGTLMVASIDPRTNVDSLSNTQLGFLDMHHLLPVQTSSSGKYVELIESLTPFLSGGLQDKLRVAYSGGDLDGYPVGIGEIKVVSNKVRIYLTEDTTAEVVMVGIPYVSYFAPSPPLVRGEDELPISTNKLTLVRYFLTTKDTGEFKVTVYDKQTQSEPRTWDINPVHYTSTQLQLGKTPVSGEIGVPIPCRVNAATGEVVFSISGMTEFNALSLEYVCRTNQRVRRR